MLLGWEQAKPPDPPHLVSVGVAGTNSAIVKIQEPLEGSLVTKFKSNYKLFFFNLIYLTSIIFSDYFS